MWRGDIENRGKGNRADITFLYGLGRNWELKGLKDGEELGGVIVRERKQFMFGASCT